MNKTTFRSSEKLNNKINSEKIIGKNILTIDEYGKRVDNILTNEKIEISDQLKRLQKGIGIHLGHYQDIYKEKRELNNWSNYKTVSIDINNFIIEHSSSNDFNIKTIVQNLIKYQDFVSSSNIQSPSGLKDKFIRSDEDSDLEKNYSFYHRLVIESIKNYLKVTLKNED